MSAATMGPDDATAADGGEGTRSFEDLLAELESVVTRLGENDLELDESLALFERGVGCLRDAGRLLDAAEGRVEELIESAAGDFEAIGFEVPEHEGDIN